jgi:hypothetical protein
MTATATLSDMGRLGNSQLSKALAEKPKLMAQGTPLTTTNRLSLFAT